MKARVAILAVVVVVPRAAGAYESQCRARQEAAASDLERSMERSVCVLPDESNQPYDGKECAPGLDAARGAQLGEHAYLTLLAMKLAGLPAYFYAYGNDPNNRVLDYYTSGDSVFGTATPSVEPTAPGSMMKRVVRPISIPEFANVPDVSYSMIDFVLGNEHCAAYPAMASGDRLTACHTFGTHMGLLNSNHFLPQGRAMYGLYHAIAMSVAGRCRAMREAFPSAGPSLHPLYHTAVDAAGACDREALAFEAVGAHFLEDAWSTGHMWNAWGSPSFEDMRFADEKVDAELDGIRGLAVAGIRGLIHGVRSLARLQKPIWNVVDPKAIQHDQLCMPGQYQPSGAIPADPKVGGSQESRNELWKIPVRWRYPEAGAGVGGLYEGGGDLYLLPCTARRKDDPQGAILTASTLAFQRARLLSCAARGFESVYKATLPAGQSGPARQADMAAKVAADLDGRPDVESSLADPCWNQRVTNESMAISLGVTSASEQSPLNDPAGLANLGVEPILVSVALDVLARDRQKKLLTTVNAELRRDLLLLSVGLAARRSQQPNGTFAAETGVVDTFLGVKKNSDHVQRITNGEVSYLERPDVNAWTATPGAGCVDDTKCAAAGMGGGQYCGRAGGGGGLACLQKEAALLHAFRRAELPAWCAQETKDSIDRAVKACLQSGSSSSDACSACVDVLLPHHRDACDATEFKKLVGGIDAKGKDHRSVCDVLLERGAIKSSAGSLEATSVYVPIGAGRIPDEVRRHCFGQPPSNASCGEGGVIFTDNSHRVASATGDCCVTSSGFCTNSDVTFEKEGAFDPSMRVITKMPALAPGESRQYTTWMAGVPYMGGSVEATASRPTNNRYSVRIHLKGLPSTPTASDVKAAILSSPRCAGLSPPATDVPSYTATTTVVPDLRVMIQLQALAGFSIVFTGKGTLDYKKNGQCAAKASCFVTLGGLHDGKTAYTSCLNNTEFTKSQQPISCADSGLVSYNGTIWLVVALRMESAPGATDARQSGATSSCKDATDSDISVDFDLVPP